MRQVSQRRQRSYASCDISGVSSSEGRGRTAAISVPPCADARTVHHLEVVSEVSEVDRYSMRKRLGDLVVLTDRGVIGPRMAGSGVCMNDGEILLHCQFCVNLEKNASSTKLESSDFSRRRLILVRTLK